jgi:DnaJ-domain-containing protein 1
MGDSAVLRPAPSGSGTLAKTPLLHVLVYVNDRKLTGTADLVSPDKKQTATVCFVAGEPSKVRTNVGTAFLSEVLRSTGVLTERQVKETIADLQAAKASGRALHGQILLERRMLDRRQLEAALKEQVLRKLCIVAAMAPETMYGFYDGYDGLRGWAGDGDPGFDPRPMMQAVLAANPLDDHVAGGLAKIGSADLRLVRDADIDRLALDTTGRRVADRLKARVRVSDLLADAGPERSAVERVIYLLLVAKLVEVLRNDSGGAGVASRMPAVPSRGPANPSGFPPAGSRSPTPAPGEPAAASTSGSASPKPGRVSSAKIVVAYPSPPPTLSGEQMARWTEITDRASNIDRADYFSMLDLARDATAEEVETAFYALAKVWHPDRLPADLAPVRDACSRVFARMSEAQATLSDEAKRKHYMTLLADGSGSPEMQETVAKVLEAATDFQKAEVCFKRADMAQAELWCRKAAEGDPTQPAYRSLLAWLTALKPENATPEKTFECIKMLDATLKENEKAESAHMWRGLLYKRIGKDDFAMRDFRRTAELNPKNIDAAREVRLYTMRTSRPSIPAVRPSDGPPKADDKGLLGRLFKK